MLRSLGLIGHKQDMFEDGWRVTVRDRDGGQPVCADTASRAHHREITHSPIRRLGLLFA